jgi:RNA polymerase sigma-70 factor (ECF subfamily)
MSDETHHVSGGADESAAPTTSLGGASSAPQAAADFELVNALRRGDEHAFISLVGRYHVPLLRLAQVYVANPAVAEEVVQDTWLGVLRGLEGFAGRSALKTWIYRILINTAKTRAQREARSVPLSALPDADGDADEPAADPAWFRPPDAEWPGHWISIPSDWNTLPEKRLLSQETLARIGEAMAALPPNQRAVIRLRDVEGWSAEEVCNILDITETNQRVLLHRARSRVRRAVARYFDEELVQR